MAGAEALSGAWPGALVGDQASSCIAPIAAGEERGVSIVINGRLRHWQGTTPALALRQQRRIGKGAVATAGAGDPGRGRGRPGQLLHCTRSCEKAEGQGKGQGPGM